MTACPYCRRPFPELAAHYAVGPNTCPRLAGAFDDPPDRSTRGSTRTERVQDAEYERQKGEQRRRNAKSYRARKAGA